MAFRILETVRAVLRELARTVLVPVVVAGRIVGWIRRALSPPPEADAQAAADEAAQAITKKPVWTEHMTQVAASRLVRRCLDAKILGLGLQGQAVILEQIRQPARDWIYALTREEALAAQDAEDDDLVRHLAGAAAIQGVLACTTRAIQERQAAEDARTQDILSAIYAEAAQAPRRRRART